MCVRRWGYLARTRIHTCGWHPRQNWGTRTVITHISLDSRYPNVCTWLGTARHSELFRHASLDSWKEQREAERERVSLDALPKRGEWNGGRRREIVKLREFRGGCSHLWPWWRDRDSQDKWGGNGVIWETEQPIGKSRGTTHRLH